LFRNGVVVQMGGGAGVAAVALTKLLELVQHLVWPGGDLLEAASRATASPQRAGEWDERRVPAALYSRRARPKIPL